jgi:hypothetical protein
MPARELSGMEGMARTGIFPMRVVASAVNVFVCEVTRSGPLPPQNEWVAECEHKYVKQSHDRFRERAVSSEGARRKAAHKPIKLCAQM